MSRSFVEAFMIELSKVGRRTRNLFDDRLRERGLTLARTRALHWLSLKSAMNQTELAAALEIEHPSVVRLLDGMERQGLIVRRLVAEDKRAKLVELTALAKDQIRGIEDLTEVIGTRLLRGIAQSDLTIALAVLRQIDANIAVERGSRAPHASSDDVE